MRVISKTNQRGILFGLTAIIGALQAIAPVPVLAQAADAANGSATDAATTYQYQIGPGKIRYYSAEDHLINALRQNTYSNIYADTRGGEKLFIDDIIAAGHFDIETQTFKSVPDGGKIFIGFVRGAASPLPALYGGDWIVEWDGDGDLEFYFGAPVREEKLGKNKRRATFADDRDKWTGVFITRVGEAGLRNVRIYRAEDEARVKAGKSFSGRFAALVSRYDIVRTMDMMHTNSSGIRTVDQIADDDSFFWGEDNERYLDPRLDVAMPARAFVELAVETGTQLWMNVPPMLGAPERFNDRAYFVRRRNDPPVRKVDFVADFAAAADEIVRSDEFDRYAHYLIDALEEENYPPDRLLIIELGNEIWNYGGGFFKSSQYFEGLAKGLALGNDLRKGYGYRSAQLAVAFEKALEERGRAQAWTIALGTQTSWAARTHGALEGVRAYAQASGTDIDMGRFAIFTTNYFGGGFHFDKQGNMFGAPDADAWRAEWLARLKNDPAALEKTIEDWLINGPNVRATLNWLIASHREHRAIAEKFGAKYLGNYEGGSHDTLDRELAKNQDAVEFYQRFMRGEPGARVLDAVNQALIAENPAVIISDFNRIGVMKDAFPPWHEQVYGDDTPIVRMLDSYLHEPRFISTVPGK